MKRLSCGVCGSGICYAKKQWWNQDRGYGICPVCADMFGVSGESQTWGKEGVHYNADPEVNVLWLAMGSQEDNYPHISVHAKREDAEKVSKDVSHIAAKLPSGHVFKAGKCFQEYVV